MTYINLVILKEYYTGYIPTIMRKIICSPIILDKEYLDIQHFFVNIIPNERCKQTVINSINVVFCRFCELTLQSLRIEVT